MADSQGNDLSKVGVALTGSAAILAATEAFTPPTTAEFAVETFTLPAGFRPLGLRTEDGAPEWTDEADGDAIAFYEDGYTIPTGLVTVEVKMTLAQTEPLVIELKTGTVLDASGVADLDLGGNAASYILYTEEVFRSSGGGYLIERRLAEVTVKSVVSTKPKRGEVRGHEVTFAARRSTRFGGKHVRYALVASA